MTSPLRRLLDRMRAGSKPTPEEWGAVIGLLPLKQQAVLVPVIEACAENRDPDLAAIGASLSPPIHRTSVLRRLRSASKLLPDLLAAICEPANQALVDINIQKIQFT